MLIGGGAGVGLIVAFALWPRHIPSDLAAGKAKQAFGNFIKIARDGRITVAVPQVETGQGIWTALAQIVADELGAAWETIAVEPAPLTEAYANPLARKDWPMASASPPDRPRCARSSSRCARPPRWRGRCWSAPRPTAGTSAQANATPPTAS